MFSHHRSIMIRQGMRRLNFRRGGSTDARAGSWSRVGSEGGGFVFTAMTIMKMPTQLRRRLEDLATGGMAASASPPSSLSSLLPSPLSPLLMSSDGSPSTYTHNPKNNKVMPPLPPRKIQFDHRSTEVLQSQLRRKRLSLTGQPLFHEESRSQEREWRKGHTARESFLALHRLVAPKSSTVACCWREGLVKGAHG